MMLYLNFTSWKGTSTFKSAMTWKPTPLRKLLILGIDQMKQGKGPLVAKTVAATLLVVFGSVINNVIEIRKRSSDAGVVSSIDEVLMAERILEASLMGFALFHAIMIDRLHYYIKELDLVREELEEAKRLIQVLENMKLEQSKVKTAATDSIGKAEEAEFNESTQHVSTIC